MVEVLLIGLWHAEYPLHCELSWIFNRYIQVALIGTMLALVYIGYSLIAC